MDWKRQAQEKEGSYYFSGRFLATREVMASLSEEEILAIYQDVQQFVKEKDGIDYLQVYKDSQDRKLFFIDQLSKEMIASGDFKPEYNYCTLLFAHEY